jgi:HK97 family phage major capsid protein
MKPMTLAQTVGTIVGAHTCFSDNERRMRLDALHDLGMPGTKRSEPERANFTLTPELSRSILATPDMMRVTTESQFGGAAGGFTIRPGFADRVFDRNRPRVSPMGLVNHWPVDTYEYLFPAVSETSWPGTFSATWGTEETALPAQSDDKVSQIRFVQNRLIIYTSVSRDVWTDSTKLERWLNVRGLTRVREMFDYALIQGVNGGPQGIIGAPGTVVVNRTTTNTIKAADIDLMWSSMYAGSKYNALWLASDEVVQTVDQAAQTGGWAENLYFPQGRGGNQFSLLKGRPLIPIANGSPALGSTGDLICWDPTDWYLTYRQAGTNIGEISISVDIPPAPGQFGVMGTPDNFLERRLSDHFLWNVDELAIYWKARCDAKSLWNSTFTNANSAVVGNAVALSANT